MISIEGKVNQIIDTVDKFARLIGEVEKDWTEIYEEIGKADLEIGDLLHEIELVDFGDERAIFLVNELKRVRRYRRMLKDYQEVIRILKDYLDKNKNLEINLFKKLACMKKQIAYQENRFYRPRIRTDLELYRIFEENVGSLDAEEMEINEFEEEFVQELEEECCQ